MRGGLPAGHDDAGAGHDELVSRKVYPVVPPKTEYSLTDLGRTLVPIVKAMGKWGESWFKRMGLPVPCDEE